MLGQRFGRLTILFLDKSVKKGQDNYRKHYICKCGCGNIVSVRPDSLKNGHTKSCGCYCTDQRLKAIRKAKGVAAFNALYAQYKAQAKRRNLEWAISKRYFKYLTKQNCWYCGSTPTNIHTTQSKINTGNYIYTGVDRINNNKGYIKNNIVPCCKICNRGKRAMKQKDFLNWIENLVNNYKGGGHYR